MNRNDRGNGGGGGCISGCLTIVVILFVLSLLTSVVGSCSYMGAGSYGNGHSYSQTTTVSTTAREKLDSSKVTLTDYYDDQAGDWIDDEDQLLDGLEYFYQKTGVQPYVIILPNGTTTSTSELASQAEELYPTLFSDEGHFLLVFCDDGNGSFNCGYYVGGDAESIMDDEALQILAENLEYQYDHATDDEEVFSEAFRDTADSIMATSSTTTTTTSSGKPIGTTSSGSNWLTDALSSPVVIAILVVAVAGGVVLVVTTVRSNRKEEERKRTEDILNTPLESFGDKDVEDLAGKYEKK